MAFESITEINLDINTPSISIIHAKQYDTARKVKAHLFSNSICWFVPKENVIAVVSYKKADRIGGFYDTTENGQAAVSIDGNDSSLIYISLDRQLLTTVGNVNVELTFYNSINASRLSTFSFIVQVEAASLSELDLVSEPYFNVLAKNISAVLNAEQSLVGLNVSANCLPPGATPSADVDGGMDTGQPYEIQLGIPIFPGFDTPTASGLSFDSNPTVSLTGGTKSGNNITKYHLEFGIPKGNQFVVTSTVHEYQNSTTASTVPTGTWASSASPVKGKYTWCRTKITWNSGDITTIYTVSYNGIDGSGGSGTAILG